MAENEIEVVRAEAANVVQWANQLVVATVDDYKAVVVRLQDIKAGRSRWVKLWEKSKANTYAAWKGVVADEKFGLDVFDRAEQTAKGKALAWKQEADRKAAEEQRRLQAEADERARRERERLEKEAGKLKTPEKIEERLEQAAAVVTPVVTVESPTAGIEGAASRKTWKAGLVSKEALIEASVPGSIAASFLEFNEKAANNFARSTKGKVPVSGVRFFEVEGLSIGRNNGE